MIRASYLRHCSAALALCVALGVAAETKLGAGVSAVGASARPAPNRRALASTATLHNLAPAQRIVADEGASTDNNDALNNAPELLRLRGRGLALPLQNVDANQLVDTYLQTRFGGVAHEALDIMAPRGTPVIAVEDGRIAKLFLSKPGGLTLYQFDPQGEYSYYYAHLDRYADGLKEGDIVRRGQIIAYVGSTGNASPDAPHLHFAVYRLGPARQWWRGTPINPFLIWRHSSP